MKHLIRHVKKFGFMSWSHFMDNKQDKLETNDNSYTMVGYSEESKVFIINDPIK